MRVQHEFCKYGGFSINSNNLDDPAIESVKKLLEVNERQNPLISASDLSIGGSSDSEIINTIPKLHPHSDHWFAIIVFSEMTNGE